MFDFEELITMVELVMERQEKVKTVSVYQWILMERLKVKLMKMLNPKKSEK